MRLLPFSPKPSLVLFSRNSFRVSLKLRLAVPGVTSLQSCIYSWRMQRGGGRVPWKLGKAGLLSPGSSLSPAASDVLACHKDTASRQHFFPLQGIPELLVTHNELSHLSVLCCQLPLDQSCLCGLPCCFIKRIIGVVTGLSKSKCAFVLACLHKTCYYSCTARTLLIKLLK